MCKHLHPFTKESFFIRSTYRNNCRHTIAVSHASRSRALRARFGTFICIFNFILCFQSVNHLIYENGLKRNCCAHGNLPNARKVEAFTPLQRESGCVRGEGLLRKGSPLPLYKASLFLKINTAADLYLWWSANHRYSSCVGLTCAACTFWYIYFNL